MSLGSGLMACRSNMQQGPHHLATSHVCVCVCVCVCARVCVCRALGGQPWPLLPPSLGIRCSLPALPWIIPPVMWAQLSVGPCQVLRTQQDSERAQFSWELILQSVLMTYCPGQAELTVTPATWKLLGQALAPQTLPTFHGSSGPHGFSCFPTHRPLLALPVV